MTRKLGDLKRFMLKCERDETGIATTIVTGYEEFKLHVYSSRSEANIQYAGNPVAKLRFDDDMVYLYRVTCGVCDFDTYTYIGESTELTKSDVRKGIGSVPQNYLIALLAEGGEKV